jgi:aldose 1-epimerase
MNLIKTKVIMFATATFLASPVSMAGTLSKAPYGTTAQGASVEEYTLKSDKGVTVKFISYGGIITEISTPDKLGKHANIVLGFSTLADYEKYNPSIHFGSLIGRYANRIANGRFELNGKTYTLPKNDGNNTLHGGPKSFDEKVWTVKQVQKNNAVAAQLTYVSPDGENGFPGTLTTHVTYALTDDNDLVIDYLATTDKDTVVNLTNHSYFNLLGEGSGSIENQMIEIAAARYTPTNKESIPTGELASVAGTPFDMRWPVRFGAHLRDGNQQMVWAHGYDHNFVLDNGGGDKPGFAARVVDLRSGRILEVHTTQPGLQLYTANWLNGGVVGSSGKTYRQSDAFALEAEHFPDSPNQPSFPSTELKVGQTYKQQTVYKFRAVR